MYSTIRHAARRAMLTILPVVAVSALAAVPAIAQDDPQARKLEGTWYTQVSAHNCTTGAVLRSFPALNTFAAGGTLIDTTTVVAPSLRSPGHGTWEATGGHTFRAISLAFLFSPAGAWTGTQRIIQAIEMREGPDEFSSTATSESFDTAGTLIGSVCATAIGQRVE